MNLAAFLVGMVGPLAARLLVSLGLTMVVMTGAVTAVATLKASVLSHMSGLPGAALQLGGLFGIWAAVGIIFGALTFMLTWQTTKGFWAFAKA